MLTTLWIDDWREAMTTPINVEELKDQLTSIMYGADWKNTDIADAHKPDVEVAMMFIDRYITNKLIEEFRNITRPNYAGIYGTYDYDGIAEAVIERVKELEALRATLSNTIEGEK